MCAELDDGSVPEPHPQQFEYISDRDDTLPLQKPTGGLWTSTYTPNESHDSDWLRWCASAKYTVGTHAWLMKPTDNVALIEIDSAADLERVSDTFQKTDAQSVPSIDRQLSFEAMVAEGYNGFHVTKRGQTETHVGGISQPTLYGWDAESTVWFDWCFEEPTYHDQYDFDVEPTHYQ